MLELKTHQTEGIEWIRRVQRGLLADEPGLGKTRIAIEAFDGGHNIVIAPGLVIDGGTWEDELRKWSSDPDNPEKWLIVPYSTLNDRDNTFYPALTKDKKPHPKAGQRAGSKPVKRLRDPYKGRWDAMVLDESHMIQGRNSLWTWACHQISRQTDATLAMTGTPIPNWAHEMFTTLQVIYPEEGRIGKKYGSFWRWAMRWFDCTPTRFSGGQPVAGELRACLVASFKAKDCLARPNTDPCEHYVEFMEDNFGERFLRRWRKDCLDLPEFTDQDVLTRMTTDQARIYREMKKDFVTHVNGETVVSWTQGSKNVALDKITTSPWLLNPKGKPKGGKFEHLRFDLESRSRPTFVVAHYQDTVEACAQVAKDVGASASFVHGGTSEKDRRRILRQFKTGNLDVLVGSLETVSEGLTLTAADMMIFVEHSYKPSRNEQATFRIYRLGQESPVTVRRYKTPNSVDQRKHKLLATKTDRQMRFMTAAEFAAML